MTEKKNTYTELIRLLKLEKEADYEYHKKLAEQLSLTEKKNKAFFGIRSKWLRQASLLGKGPSLFYNGQMGKNVRICCALGNWSSCLPRCQE